MASELPKIPPVAPASELKDRALQTAAFNLSAIAEDQTNAEYAWHIRYAASLLRGLAQLPRAQGEQVDV